MPQAPAPPNRKSGSGCLIALGVVGGLFLLVLAVVGLGVWKLASTPQGKAMFGAIGEATKAAAEAQNAPGAAQVRALGCDQAMVLDMARVSKIFEQLDASAPQSSEFSVLVVCQVGSAGGSAPSCDEVARVYRSAAGATARPFAANVKRPGRGGEICSSVYDAEGRKVRDLPTGSTPHLAGDH
jgi:hypothetical protein